MACSRDCVGSSINNITNLCGVQIAHNCSPGCTGLSNGQSRLQIDANGNLVVCSNVGGTCNCTTSGTGTDSLVDNNDGTITHTNVAGSQEDVDICAIVASHCNPSLAASGGDLEFTDIAGVVTTIDVCAMLDSCSLDDLGDVVLTGPVVDEVLTYDGTDWVNATVPVNAADICAAVAADCDIAVVNNGDGTFTITDIGGTGTTLDVCNMVSDGGCTDSLIVVGSVVTHTALDGTIQNFDVCALVAANCDVTTIDNGDGTFTITNVGGTPTTLDVCTLITAGGCTDSLIVAGSVITHTALNGNVQAFDICTIVANNCDIGVADNGDGTFTITDIGGTDTTIDVCDLITDGGCLAAVGTDTLTVVGSLVTHTALDSTVVAFDVCDLVANNCNAALTSVGSVLQFTDNAGANTNIDICTIVQANCTDTLTVVGSTFTHTAVDGTVQAVDICALVAANCSDTLVDNGNGTYTHTSINGLPTLINVCGDVANHCNPSLADIGGGVLQFIDVAGGPTNIDICAMVAANCSDTLVNNGDGTYTHTAVDGTATIIDICSALSVVDSDCIDLTLTPAAGGCEITADIIVSADDCNGVECRADGVYVNNDFQPAFAQTSANSINYVIAGPVPAACTYFGGEQVATITNPSICNNMIAELSLDANHLVLEQFGVNPAEIVFRGEVNYNGGGWTPVDNLGGRWIVNQGDVVQVPIGSNTALYNLAPGAAGSLGFRICISNPDGNFNGNAGRDTINIAGKGFSHI